MKRIVCLTEETTETLYLLGEEERIVGISAYTCRPPEAKRDKPVVSAFVRGSIKKIKALEPDLVIGFSDIQAELAKELIENNLQVLIFNQRSVQEILDTILVVGRLVDAEGRASELVTGFKTRIDAARERGFIDSLRLQLANISIQSVLVDLSSLVIISFIFLNSSSGRIAKPSFVFSIT